MALQRPPYHVQMKSGGNCGSARPCDRATGPLKNARTGPGLSPLQSRTAPKLKSDVVCQGAGRRKRAKKKDCALTFQERAFLEGSTGAINRQYGIGRHVDGSPIGKTLTRKDFYPTGGQPCLEKKGARVFEDPTIIREKEFAFEDEQTAVVDKAVDAVQSAVGGGPNYRALILNRLIVQSLFPWSDTVECSPIAYGGHTGTAQRAR